VTCLRAAVMADPRRRQIEAKDVVIAGHAKKIVARAHRIEQLTWRPELPAAAELPLHVGATG
jgi:hypothetical protein